MAFFGNGGALAAPIPPLFGVEVLAIPVGRKGKIPATPKTTLGFGEAQRGFPGPSPTLLPGRSPGRDPENLHFFLGKTQFPARCRSRWVGFSIFSLAQGITAPRCPQARREPAEAHGREDAGQVNPGAPSSCLCLCPGNPRIPVLLIDHVRSFLSGDWPLLLNLF